MRTDLLYVYSGADRYGVEILQYDNDPRTDEFVHHGFQRLRIEILIPFRDHGFVDHHDVEIIPPSQLLRVPSHPPGRTVLVDDPELRLAPRILPLSKLLLRVRFYHLFACFSY